MGFGYSYFDIGIYLPAGLSAERGQAGLVFGAWVLEFHIRHADRSGGISRAAGVTVSDFPQCNGGKLYRTVAGGNTTYEKQQPFR